MITFEQDNSSFDETAYLSRSPNNLKRLLEALCRHKEVDMKKSESRLMYHLRKFFVCTIIKLVRLGGYMFYWQLQEAKAKLSELIKLTLQKGPQGISVRGKKECVLLAREEYEKLIGKKPDFLTFIASSPLKGTDLDIQRDKSLTRDVDL
jgi:prevent-host-death family protein